ncbi:universal stress protein [Kitasatospora sp. LaBMicrA B282]|uniref:universal stress protein n=1 Tax=Kitasatospora sp. LaBMicrA B282 TaxID=3420949 RepID=UPI003D0DF565
MVDSDPGGSAPQHRVVVGVSGSLGSLAALHRAVLEARYRAAQLLVVHAWEAPGGERGYRRYPASPLLEAAYAAAAETLDEALAWGGSAGAGDVALVGELVRGAPGAALVAAADREQDLLVVGAGGGLLRRGLWPSVAGHCVKRARGAVLVVPRPPLQRELESFRRRVRWHLPTEPVPGR